MTFTVRYTSFPNAEFTASIFREPLLASTGRSGISLSKDNPGDYPVGSQWNDSEASAAPLDIKKKLETRKDRRQDALTSYGKKTLIRSGSAYPEKSDRECDVMLTGTLPSRMPSAFRALAIHSNLVVQRVRHWVLKGIEEPLYQWVWERQKRGALHLHFAARVPLHLVEKLRSHFKEQWIRCLDAVGELEGVDMYAKTLSYSHPKSRTQTDVSVLSKEPSRYLSKYIAKGGTATTEHFQPVRWYQVSRKLLWHLREKTVVSERSALTYAQARAIAEDIKSQVESSTGKWWNLKHLGWSFFACQYQYSLQPEKGRTEMTDSNANGNAKAPIAPVVARVRSYLKDSPATRSLMHGLNRSHMEHNVQIIEAEAIALLRVFLQAVCITTSRRSISPNEAQMILLIDRVLSDRDIDSTLTPQFRAHLEVESARR